MRNSRAPQAFTLIELLVVICILAILMAMFIPIFRHARDKSTSNKQAQSSSSNDTAYLPIENPNDANKQAIISSFEEQNHVTVTSSKYYIKVEYVKRNRPGY
jgi:prepilin-type N-terminal cleavage/methylation domain-containing protein